MMRLFAASVATMLVATSAHASDFLNECMVEIATLPIVAAAWIHGESSAVDWPARHGDIAVGSRVLEPEAPSVVAVPEAMIDAARADGEYWGVPNGRSTLLAAAAAPLLPYEWIHGDATQVDHDSTATDSTKPEGAKPDGTKPDVARINGAKSPAAISPADPAADMGTVVMDEENLGQDLISAALSPLPREWLRADPMVESADTPTATKSAAEAPPPVKVAAADATCAPLLQQTFNLLQTGEPQSLCRYQGKVLLIVNTASYCGYTPQYEGLEALYRKYKDRGLVVIGFPSNDYGGQEPGTNKEIAEFCRTTYGVEFPQYEKSHVSGTATLTGNALYLALGKQTGKVPEWNFHKYLVNRAGTPVASFGSATKPSDPTLTETLERLLNEKSVATKG